MGYGKPVRVRETGTVMSGPVGAGMRGMTTAHRKRPARKIWHTFGILWPYSIDFTDSSGT